MVSDTRKKNPTMALTGLKPPGALILEGDINTNWKQWFKAYDIYSIAAGVSTRTEKVQCNVFLHVAGTDAQNIHTQLPIAEEDTERITPLIEAFRTYCQGKANRTVLRYKFNTYTQMNNSMDGFIAGVRARAADCEFGALEPSLICDRIVCGIGDDILREKLLHTQNLTLEQCVTLCRISEIKSSDVAETNAVAKEIDTLINAARRGGNTRQPYKQQDRQYRNKENEINMCDWCGFSHKRGSCPARGKQCNNCGKLGHFGKVCRSRTTPERTVNAIHTDAQPRDRDEDETTGQQNEEYLQDLYIGALFMENKNNTNLWYKTINVGGQNITFKVDTGSEANVIPTHKFEKLQGAVMTKPTCNIISYSGHHMTPTGETELIINNTPTKFLIVREGSPILGKQTCEKLGIISRIDTLTSTNDDSDTTKLVNKYNDIFKGLGLVKTDAHIYIDNTVEPCIDPPRRIPHAIQPAVRKELDRMIKIGVIVEQNEPTDWVNSITIVKKPNKIRVCLDPTRLNKAIKRGAVPVRTVEEVTAKLSGANYFSVIDANCGYWQIELDKSSSLLCTFNTPWGRYRYTRLPFGIKTAGDIFMKEMNNLLSDLPGVEVITDDILIYGKTKAEHNERLEAVLQRARTVNLKLNPTKTVIGKQSVNYVGHIISNTGVTPCPKRVQAINDMPTPTDKHAVQRFLGMVNYVHKFIPNMSSIAKPLRVLLEKNVPWHWEHEQKAAFEKLKSALVQAPVLAFYDKTKPLTLQVDACNSGLGATLIQEGKPIAMASRALDKTQTQYATIEKELLAICFGTNRFHDYVFGREIMVETDHRPLISILTKPLHNLSARMQRMRMRLQNYNIEATHVKGTRMFFADTLSRAHTTVKPTDQLFDDNVYIAEIQTDIIHQNKIQTETNIDETLTTIKQLTQNGWPEDKNKIPTCAKPYHTFRDEINIQNNMLWKGQRIIIPKSLQKQTLQRVHETHLGISKTQQLARDTIFWPGMTKQIQDMISRCETCQQNRQSLHSEPMINHEIPNKIFAKVGVDLFEHELKTYLILVDYYTKFPEITELHNTTSKSIINAMAEIFGRFGIPEQVMSDNGPQFASTEYKEFAKHYGFKPIHSSPQYPQSNGQVERYVQSIKNMMKKNASNKININLALLNFRNTPLNNIDASPAQLLMSRRLRSRIPSDDTQLKPKIQNDKTTRIKENQRMQKLYYDKHTGKQHKLLQTGNTIQYRTHKNTWAKGTIITSKGPGDRSYQIQNNTGKEITRNRKHIIQTMKPENKEETITENDKKQKSNGTTKTYHEATQVTTRYGRKINPRIRLDL